MKPPARKRRRKLWILAVLVVVFGGLITAAVLRKHEPVLTVQTEKVQRRDITERVVANGRIQPITQVKISAEVSGEIIEMPVREGQKVRKGDLLVRIKPDTYDANVRSAEAACQSSLARLSLVEANVRKADLDFQRNRELHAANLVAESVFLEYETSLQVVRAQLESARHDVEIARASLTRAKEELAKTTIYSPLSGTLSDLRSEIGEKVVGTAMMTGTEIMTIANLEEMEARVDIGEMDIVLLEPGQSAKLEVDAFRDREFEGTVTEVANSARTSGGMGGNTQEATKFEVKIRIDAKEAFRPGMSVTAEIATRSRTNVLSVPAQCVTTRPPKPPEKTSNSRLTNAPAADTASETNATAVAASGTAPASAEETATASDDSATNAAPDVAGSEALSEETGVEADEKDKPRRIEVVFVREGDVARMVPVERGISDENHTEIVDGLSEGQEIISGGYKAISKDLTDGAKIRVGPPAGKDQGEPKQPGS